MTPAETLAAARSNVVGPYVPARVEWLDGWCGPVQADVGSGYFAAFSIDGAICDHREAFGWTAGIRLDLRRPEVQDHLIRRGAPEWARDVPAAMWVWATSGKAPSRALPKWAHFGENWFRFGSSDGIASVCDPGGWGHERGDHPFVMGPETGLEGMACADLAALRAGCILEEPDGWLVPLPDGGIGFWPRGAE